MENKKILMVAAENDALPGAKVGGVGDVLRDVPNVLARKDCDVEVVLPSYGFLARLDNAQRITRYSVVFAGKMHEISLMRIPVKSSPVNNLILHHKDFAPKGESVYCNDSDTRPFATDATKFALFCAAVAQGLKIGALSRPDVIHCHDWHSAFLLILLNYSPQYSELKNIHSVYTIHNLAMQGVRPFSGDESSFETWYPDVGYGLDMIADPSIPRCVNPMRAGINLANKVHVVSPTYAQEIQTPSDHIRGVYGGEGLEEDLKRRNESGDLIGILNGCEYPKGVKYVKKSRKTLAPIVSKNLLLWAAKSATVETSHWIAAKRIQQWAAKRSTGITLTSIGRVTEQKARILQEPLSCGMPALHSMLERLEPADYFIMLGSGSPELELFFTQVSAKYENFIFLNGYSNDLPDEIYNMGDLFIMPSSFEPCGISQMLAMRAGQPCLVNQVGGLKDTVHHGKNGFSFQGATVTEQALDMVTVFEEALNLYRNNQVIWERISQAASKTRITWDASVQFYLDDLYS